MEDPPSQTKVRRLKDGMLTEEKDEMFGNRRERRNYFSRLAENKATKLSNAEKKIYINILISLLNIKLFDL